MRSGTLRHLVSIQSYTTIKNEVGEETETWAEFTKAWCDIKPLNGSEKYVSAEKHATATHQIITRYQAGITTKMKIVARGRTFEIEEVLNIGERDRMIRIIATEQVA